METRDKNSETEADEKKKNESVWDVLATPRLALVPEELTAGEYLTVVYAPAVRETPAKNFQAVLYGEKGKRLASARFFDFQVDGHTVQTALLAVPSTCEPGTVHVRAELSGVSVGELSLSLLHRKFNAEVIPLSPSNTSLRTEPDPQKTAEAERLWAIIGTTGQRVWAEGPFITPVPASTRRSSFFGDRRVYRYSNGKGDTSVHAGIDFAVPRGTEVKACAAGRVVLACSRIVTGNSVIIEHLPGVYSIYYHLDKINAREGDEVRMGDIIALSGNTGLSTGAHLHWEIRVATENADPDAFTARPALDSQALFNALFQ